ncbi:MAG: hypothetical protein CME60_03220 [Halobacteriovoraceae bacterium]|nr:hypothetical protein [Halobacteriovoraceae bacterium]
MIKEPSKNTFLKDLLGGVNSNPHSIQRGDSGQSELLFIFMTFCFLSLMILFSHKMILHFKMSQQRQRTYLCIKEGFEDHIEAKRWVQYTNYAITAAYASLAFVSPAATPVVHRIISVLKKVHIFILLKSFFDISMNRNCTWEQKLLMVSYTPMAINWKKLRLERFFLGHAKFKSKKKTFIFPSQSMNHSDFIIKGKVLYKDDLILSKTREFNFDILDSTNHAALKAHARSLIMDFKTFFKNPTHFLKDLLGIMI